jgi:acetyltransferase-like isoleucine patch superfamily enzyme
MKIPKNPLTIYLKKVITSLVYKIKYINKNLFIEHPSIIRHSTFGNYVKIYNNTIVNSSIDSYSYLGNNTQVLNARIGKFCSVGADCKIGMSNHPVHGFVSTHPIFYSKKAQVGITFSDKDYFEEDTHVLIGNDVWIGMNVLIIGNVAIGDGAVIAAGSVVTKNIEPYSIVGGVPAKHIKYRFSENDILQLQEDKWWLRSHEDLQHNFLLFHNIDNYVKAIK